MNLLKNYLVHNFIGHPTMAALSLIGLDQFGDMVHDATIPEGDLPTVVGGTVIEYGGGEIRILVDRDTEVYPTGRVEVRKP